MYIKKLNLKYLLTIVACLSGFILSAQDLELITPVKPKAARTTSNIESISEEKNISSELTGTTLTVETLDTAPSAKSKRNNISKEDYLNELLRKSYYQKITTPTWSKYLNPTSWNKTVKKWRYWNQLKTFVTSNEDELLTLQVPIEVETKNTVEKPPLIEQSTIPDAAGEVMDATSQTEQIALDIPKEETKSEETKPELIDEVVEKVVAEKVMTTKTGLVEFDFEPTVIETKVIEPDTASIDAQEEITDVIAAVEETKEDPADKAKEIEEVKKEVTKVIPEKEETKKVVAKASEKEQIQEITKTPVTSIKNTPTTASKTNTAPVNNNRPKSRKETNAAFAREKGSMPWPISGGRITDRFGIRKNALARGLRPENFGVDMLAPPGSSIKAVHDGVVILAMRQSPYDFIVSIKHGDYTTSYYYLIEAYVKPGDVITKGQTLGKLRTSVSEADFHFEVWIDQRRENPELWLRKR